MHIMLSAKARSLLLHSSDAYQIGSNAALYYKKCLIINTLVLSIIVIITLVNHFSAGGIKAVYITTGVIGSLSLIINSCGLSGYRDARHIVKEKEQSIEKNPSMAVLYYIWEEKHPEATKLQLINSLSEGGFIRLLGLLNEEFSSEFLGNPTISFKQTKYTSLCQLLAKVTHFEEVRGKIMNDPSDENPWRELYLSTEGSKKANPFLLLTDIAFASLQSGKNDVAK